MPGPGRAGGNWRCTGRPATTKTARSWRLTDAALDALDVEKPNPFRIVDPPCISCTARTGYSRVVSVAECTCHDAAIAKRSTA